MRRHSPWFSPPARHWLRCFTAVCWASGLFALGAVQAAGLWVWTDDSGRKVYSDIPPPTNVPNGRIVQRPSGKEMPTSAAEVVQPENGVSPKAADSPVKKADKPEDVAKSAEAQRKAEAEKKTIERRNAEIRADNCERAKASQATFELGGRLAMVNEQGQRVILDQAMRNAEKARLAQIIQDNCR